jgi:HD superfamily phosphohydrolase YqeK
MGHIARVAALLREWADALGVGETERARWLEAARLHDSLRDVPPERLASYAPPALPPKVWHGPAAAVLAERDGLSDRGVLDAVRYHTVGFAGWDDVGRMLYLADYLEPGRGHDSDLAELRRKMPHSRDEVLREVARRRLAHLLARLHPIPRETWEFWNRLVADGSSSSR